MLFSSIRYLVFLTITVLLYYLIPHRFRLILLLASSLYFYASWNPRSMIWLLSITAASYIAGLLLSRTEDIRKRRMITVISAGGILSILLVFKYLSFFLKQFFRAADILGIDSLSAIKSSADSLSFAAPIGISFYTFMALSYVFDVSRRKIAPTDNIGHYGFSIAFFPHLLEGPIDRPGDLLQQIAKKHDFDYDSFCHGLALFLFGAFKKVVIADRLTLLVDTVFNNVHDYTGQAFWVASVFYTFQIYCDFSGYTDMALGSAELLGFKLTENFKRPYLATSISDFWRRWHISLSRWFRDYIYIPLGGNRCSETRWAINVLVVFLISGLWHGASWTFIFWGLFHGLCQVIGKYKSKISSRIFHNETLPLKIFRILVTFLIVNILWVLFRANSFHDFLVICKRSFSLSPDFSIFKLGAGKGDVLLSLLLIAFVILTDVISELKGGYRFLQGFPVIVRRGLYMICIFTILLFGIYGSLSADSFIYFTF